MVGVINWKTSYQTHVGSKINNLVIEYLSIKQEQDLANYLCTYRSSYNFQ